MSLTLGVNGEVVIADYSNHRFVIFDADGEYVRHFGTYGETEEKLSNHFGVVMRDNTILVSNHQSGSGRIQEFDVNGAYLRTIYTAQQRMELRGMCVTDQHIAVCCTHLHGKTQSGIKLLSKQSVQVVHEMFTPGAEPWYIAYDNNKYFISYVNQNHVDVYDENLALLYTFGSKGKEGGQFDCARGLAVHGGQLFVCDGNNHRVQVFTQDGHFITSFGSHGSGTGQMNWPIDVVVTPDRKVLVLENNGSRVQLWQ